MRIFSAELEERVRRHGLLGEWRGCGLLDPAAAARAAADLGEPPAIAARPVRGLLFLFAALCAGAVFALLVKDQSDRFLFAAASFVAAALAAAAAEALIRTLGSYRQGAEEALAAAAVAFAAFGAGGLASRADSMRVGAAVFACAAALAYARYGYRLMALFAVLGLGWFVGVAAPDERSTRLLLAGIYAALLAGLSAAPFPRRERERLELVRFLLAFSVPLCLNLRLSELVWSARPAGALGDWYSWASFAAIFALPAVWLAWGARARSRALLWAGGLGLLIAVCSIKPYLGQPRRAWDPISLGAALAVLALVLKRWLDSGPAGRRGPFSSAEMSGLPAGGALSLLAGALAGGAAPAPAPAPPQFRGGGGGAGGAGASGGF